MKRIHLDERPHWRDQAEHLGFIYHTEDGDRYWDESRAYVFTMQQIEDDLEDPTDELYELCLDVVDRVVANEEWLTKLAIPDLYWDWIRQSWTDKELSLYGRFDLAYDGSAPAKLLEFNADTPTALYEAGTFQWVWFEDQMERGVIPRDSDQFNSVHDRMVDRFKAMFEPGSHLHFSCCKGTIEDRATVEYIQDCATQTGIEGHFVYIEDVGVDNQGRFADLDGVVIDNWFKLYPYEDMFRERFGPFLPVSGAKLIEPPWKAILSNKGILPLLWQIFPGHPNLLPAYFEDDAPADAIGSGFVRKPLFSREGANVEIYRPGQPPFVTPGGYGAEGWIVQSYQPIPAFEGDYTVIGSWVIGDEAAGIGIREDSTLITRDLSRFVPHVILS